MLYKANRHGRRSSFPAIQFPVEGENGFARLVDSRVIPVCPQTPLDLESTESPDDGDDETTTRLQSVS